MKRHHQQHRDCSKPLNVGSAAVDHGRFNRLSLNFQVKNVPLPVRKPPVTEPA
jgi:hypothetical protein